MNIDLLDTVLVSHAEQTPPHPDNHKPPTTMTISKDAPTTASPAGDVDKCPVDHKTRETWIQQARAADAASAASSSSPTKPEQPQPTSSSSWASWLPFSRSSTPTTTTPSPTLPPNHPSLDESRVVSTIPRASTPAAPTARPSNHELETGASPTGNWIYPSEKMFFDAMKRKGFDSARAADMKTVVPIHNAVNERAWAEILRWEAPYAAPCGGPRLHSFAGISERMTPKARINTLLGYTAPFDRHDWVVDRCGTQVEYVIDFYAGRNDGEGQGKLNFYLDVRPKLNTWEGVKMRALRVVGLA